MAVVYYKANTSGPQVKKPALDNEKKSSDFGQTGTLLVRRNFDMMMEWVDYLVNAHTRFRL